MRSITRGFAVGLLAVLLSFTIMAITGVGTGYAGPHAQEYSYDAPARVAAATYDARPSPTTYRTSPRDDAAGATSTPRLRRHRFRLEAPQRADRSSLVLFASRAIRSVAGMRTASMWWSGASSRGSRRLMSSLDISRAWSRIRLLPRVCRMGEVRSTMLARTRSSSVIRGHRTVVRLSVLRRGRATTTGCGDGHGH